MLAQVQKEKIKARTTVAVSASASVVPENLKLRRYRFSVDDYHAMVEVGVLKEDERVELIEGEVVEMSPIGDRHTSCVKRLTTLLVRRIGEQATISIQDPVQANDFSEPQPDVALLKYRTDFYEGKHPTAKDTLIVIEVSDSTIDFDRAVKMPLYARSKIPQAVIVNLPSDVVEAYSKPVKGKYTKVQLLKRGQSLQILKLPDLMLTIDEILG